MSAYLDQPAQWDALTEAALRKGVMGLDTETYGHNVRESSPAFRAKIDVWSVALQSDELAPIGYHRARGAVLPASALDHPGLRRVLTGGEVLLVLHNAGHDQHSMANHGVELAPVYDTLEATRLLWPRLGLYTLKMLRQTILGKAARESFKELTAPEKREVKEQVERHKGVHVCSCGVVKCKKKKPDGAHIKTEATVTWLEEVTKLRTFNVPIESIGPGHPRFLRKIEYAADDAVDAVELREMCDKRAAYLDAKLPGLPW
jgi:CDGSH-type Zn-finger protein